jgi:hypothetical protein
MVTYTRRSFLLEYDMKPLAMTSTVGGLLLALTSTLVSAQNRVCVVDDATWDVVCGRVATQSEINDYFSSYRSDRTQNNVPQTYPAPSYQTQPAAVANQPAYPAPNYQTPAYPTYQQPAPVPVVVAPVYQQPPPPQPGLLEILVQQQQRDNASPNNERMSEREANRLVNGLYREVLGREADFTSLKNFSKEAMGGRSARDIRSELARSEEAKQAIGRLYQEVLGRPADPGGLANFHRKLVNGATLDQIRSELANSDEGKRRR